MTIYKGVAKVKSQIADLEKTIQITLSEKKKQKVYSIILHAH